MTVNVNYHHPGSWNASMTGTGQNVIAFFIIFVVLIGVYIVLMAKAEQLLGEMT